jgi:ADP-ribosylglycohydrolase
MNRPNPNSYWVVPGKLLASEYPGHKDAAEMRTRLNAFLECSVDAFVDLTEEGESGLKPFATELDQMAAALGRQFAHCRHPIPDLDVPSVEVMRAILDRMDALLAEGRVVCVHCWGGVGRTGTVVGCWLVRHGQTGDGALKQIETWWQTMEKKHRRPRSPETPAQREFVRQWKEPVKAGSKPVGFLFKRGTSPQQMFEAIQEMIRDAEGPACLKDAGATSLGEFMKAHHKEGKQRRCRGSLLGLAVGDALGTTLEFKSPGSFEPIHDMVGGGPFGLKPGQWTDDTSMALCLATSLVECGGFDAADQMRRYVRWWREGYLSSTGRCFDIGNATRDALGRFEQSGDPLAGSTDPHTAGNGSLMRLAPVALAFANDAEKAIQQAAESSRTTHGAATAVDACRYFASLLVGVLWGRDKKELLAPHFCVHKDYWTKHPLHTEVAAVAAGSFKQRKPPQIRGTGYVVQSLEAALWAFHSTDNFRDGCLAAVNLGDDADTTGAIYGQLAGAYYGPGQIPASWLEKLTLRETIEALADRLPDVSRSKEGRQP